MTRKDYRAMALVLKEHLSIIETPEGVLAWGTLCHAFADMLAEDNSRFDRNTFLMACGWTEAFGVALPVGDMSRYEVTA